MKILFAISQLGGGGAERVISILSSELAKAGHDVSVLIEFSHPIAYEIDKRVTIIKLDCNKSGLFSIFEHIPKIRNTIKSVEPDIVISFLPVVNMEVLLASLGLKHPVIVCERNDPNQNPRYKAVRVARNILYRLSDGFVFQTDDAKKYFGKSVTKGVVIGNPLNNDLPMPYTGCRSKRFVSAVRLTKQKNLDMLLIAFSKIHEEYPEYKLEIYGDGPEKDRLINLAERLSVKPNVEFKGFSKKLYEEILDAAVFVLPSDYEGLSNSMLEALALGIPVISTDHPIGGAKMYIKDGTNGFLTEVGSVESMYNTMKFSITNPNKMAEMAAHASQIRYELSVDRITNKWVEYIVEVLQ